MVIAAVLGQTESQRQLLPGMADALLLTRGRILSPFLPLPILQKRAEMRDILKHPQASKEVARTCGHADNQNFLHTESAILIILKDLRFFFNRLGCSQVNSMATGQQPFFLKADNQSSGCLSAHQPLIKMSEHIG